MCPIYHCKGPWFEDWINVQKNNNRVVLVKIGGKVQEYTIGQLKELLWKVDIQAINIDYDGEHIDDITDELIKIAAIKGYLTIYDNNHLISIGREAFRGDLKLTTVNNIDDVMYIGRKAFLGCTNLKELSFRNKKDAYIPNLDDVNAFHDENGNILDVNIVVPDVIYDDWIKSTNWNVLAKHQINGKSMIRKASEYVN